MGKGDKKTRKGKIAMGSYGKTRPHDIKVASSIPPETAGKTAVSEKPENTKKPSA
ncbi:30S ribosomal protein THX [Mucilaginibacter sp.]